MADIYIVADTPEKHDQIYDWYDKSRPANVGDSGIDIYIIEDESFSPGVVSSINLGIRCQIISKRTKRPMAYWLMQRSSISKTSLRMANSIGLIDHGYQGPIIAKVDILHETKIKKGERYFQLVIPEQMNDPLGYKIDIHVIKNFETDTDRGSGGFGSTGS